MKPVIEPIYNRKNPGTVAYKWFFYSHASKGILREHRVKFKNRRVGRDEHFVLYPEWKQKWYELFKVPENISVPFTYSDFSRAIFFMKSIEDVGVNFKYILHLKSEFWFYKELRPEEVYVIDYMFDDVLRIKPDKAAAIGSSAISLNGEQYMKMRDHFVIKELPAKDAAFLQKDDTDEFKGIKHVPAKPLMNCQVQEINIPETLAKRYGAISGDRNIVHTSVQIAKLFGYDRPFIQGLCTANLIMSKLCMANIKLEHFSITFALPVFLESNVFLYHTEKEYRLQDEEKRVLCFGQIN